MNEQSADNLIGSTIAVSTAVATSLPTVAINSSNSKPFDSELKDSDHEIGVDDGCVSCYSSSIRDLLCEDLPEDCTFNGPDELQVRPLSRLTHA